MGAQGAWVALAFPRRRSYRLRGTGERIRVEPLERRTAAPERITELLHAADGGDRDALEALFPVVYDQLIALARRQRREWHGNPTLDTTALVHEAYLKLTGRARLGASNEGHFFGIAAMAMRHILCNYARDRLRKKRGGEFTYVSLGHADRVLPDAPDADESAEVLASLDDALRRLGDIDERQRRIVECRFFGGMSVEDTAAALGISPATVKRDWTIARTWLYRELNVTDDDVPSEASRG